MTDNFLKYAKKYAKEKRRRVHLKCQKIVNIGRQPFGGFSGIKWLLKGV